MIRQLKFFPVRFAVVSGGATFPGEIVVVDRIVTDVNPLFIEDEIGKMSNVMAASDKTCIKMTDNRFFHFSFPAACPFGARMAFIHHDDPRPEKPSGVIEKKRPMPVRRNKNHPRAVIPEIGNEPGQQAPEIKFGFDGPEIEAIDRRMSEVGSPFVSAACRKKLNAADAEAVRFTEFVKGSKPGVMVRSPVSPYD